jgi:hypothetical protein
MRFINLIHTRLIYLAMGKLEGGFLVNRPAVERPAVGIRMIQLVGRGLKMLGLFLVDMRRVL